MKLIILTTEGPWTIDHDVPADSAASDLWAMIQAGDQIIADSQPRGGRLGASYSTVFNPEHVIAIYEQPS